MSIKNESISCFYCHKSKPSWKDLKRCGRCRGPLYCDENCQLRDWPSHKNNCKKASDWYDGYRACKDGSVHEGRLELITWDTIETEDGYTMELGWGGVVRNEASDHRRKFEEEYNGDLKKFFNYWPQGFRWTCCGMGGDQNFGCDHHGAGKKPCTCDFCRMGKPLPDSIYRRVTQSNQGLRLRRGPDPRSFNPALAAINASARTVMGLEM